MNATSPTRWPSLLVMPLCAVLGLVPSGSALAQGYGNPYAPPSGGVRPIDQSPRPDLPLYQPPIWQGLYLGGHLGGDLGASGGATGGVHLGYNWQRDNFVAGLELEGDVKSLQAAGSVPGLVTATGVQDWQSSMRLRLGYGVGNALLYATGGFAVGNLSLDVNDRGKRYSHESTMRGFVLGAGVDMKFSANISGRIEALHYGFAEKTYNFPTVQVRGEVDTTTVRAGLTYHFN